VFRGICVLHDCVLVQSILENVVFGTAEHEDSLAGDAVIRVSQATLRNVYVGAGCRIEQSLVGAGVEAPDSPFGIGLEIEPGIETGGRAVRLHPDWTFPAAAARVAQGAAVAGADTDARRGEDAWFEELLSVLPAYDTLVLDTACISGTSVVRGSIIGFHAVVDGALSVEDATLLSTAEQRLRCGTGSVVRASLLQEGVTVETGALVERSMLFETAHVERHGKVTESLIAPNTEIGEGEVTASVVGPFVGIHHQSLLIAALWPEGRGNIGYGANVGSNHTSRTADQEIWPGEGTFFGLGTSVKFPANFRDAPYSVIATGCTTLPQRVGMPFSLITTQMTSAAAGRGGGTSYPPGINQILPGWGLYANAYALFRNERKFRTRNRARRHGPPKSIVEPALIGALQAAIEALQPAREAAAADLVDWTTVPALGKNFATPDDLRRGVEAYERFARFFALYLRLSAAVMSASVKGTTSEEPVSEEELSDFDAAFSKIYSDAERSRWKDIERGRRIIDDYEAVHPSLDADPVLSWLRVEIGGLSQRVRDLAP